MDGKSLVSCVRLSYSSFKRAVEPAAHEDTGKDNITLSFFAVLSFFSSLLFHKSISKMIIYCVGTWKLGYPTSPKNQPGFFPGQ